MDIKYRGASIRRRALVTAIGEILNTEPVYQAAPTFAYSIGEVTVDRNGIVSFDDSIDPTVFDQLIDGLAERGFEAENIPELETTDGVENEIETLAHLDQLVIEMPREGFSESAITNLERLLASKASLIKNALGVESVAIEVIDETIRFPWFSGSLAPEAINAYARFIGALCAMAKNQKRVTATEKPVDNEKYAFRCFLLRLGFIGQEYRTERKILLSKLSGNASWKTISAPGTGCDVDEDQIRRVDEGGNCV